MDVPTTVRAALADRQVAGRVCLEAGAGAGNTTAGLLDAGAERVYAVTDDPSHARTVRRQVGPAADRLVVIEGDLRATPLATDSVDLVTAHGLCNVLSPAALDAVLAEVGRVAGPGSHLVVDDYAPLPDGAAVNDLFAVENAAAHLATGEAALTFYPPELLRQLLTGAGWSVERERTLLDPVPWTENHLSAHADVVERHAEAVPDPLGAALLARANDLVERIGSESAGRMYSLAALRPERG